MRRKVKDVMTTTVAVVAADTPFKEVARRLSEHRVAALPVVDARDRSIGIVSEADLLLKEEHPAPSRRRLLEGPRSAAERRKAAGSNAGDIMSSPVVTISPDAPLAAAAKRMHEGGYRSLPVVDDDGKLVGIVARRDLLRAFLRPDDQIRDEIEEEILRNTLWLDPTAVTVSVDEGVVTLEGRLDRASTIPIVVRMVYGVDGVVRVVDRLAYEFDDTEVRAYAPTPSGVAPYGTRW
jgi:CBS domain-containing protein